MAQKLTKVAETTTLANTDTLIVVDESAQNADGSTGALKRIPKSSAGFAFPSDITSAIDTEVSNRNTAITNAINTEVSNRNTAISNAIDTEVDNRNNAIDEAVSTKADAIVKTASGEIASFSDGGDELPMKSLKVNIVPKQSGSGDPSPSNVRPISGWDEVEVVRTGYNLFDPNSMGQINTTTVRSDYISVVGGNNYEMLFGEAYTYSQLSILEYNASKTKIGQSLIKYGSGALSGQLMSDTVFVKIEVYKGGGVTVSDVQNANPCFHLVSSGSGYQPYIAPETKSIALPSTVYGGTLDVVSGKLSIDVLKIAIAGYPSIGSTSTSGGTRQFYLYNLPNLAKVIPSTQIDPNMFCNVLPTKTANQTYAGVKGVSSGSGYIYFYDPDIQSEADWRTFATANNMELTYSLRTPIEIQLTPTEVKTLLGNNNIWANSGSVEVEYRADTTLAYNELLSLIASLS